MGNLIFLEDDVVDRPLLETVAHRESGLPASDDGYWIVSSGHGFVLVVKSRIIKLGFDGQSSRRRRQSWSE